MALFYIHNNRNCSQCSGHREALEYELYKTLCVIIKKNVIVFLLQTYLTEGICNRII